MQPAILAAVEATMSKSAKLYTLIQELVLEDFTGELNVKFSEGGVLTAFTTKKEI